jgi:gamma-glutamyl phosphate reductase
VIHEPIKNDLPIVVQMREILLNRPDKDLLVPVLQPGPGVAHVFLDGDADVALADRDEVRLE